MDSHGSEKISLFPLHVRTAYADLLNRLQDLEASNAMASFTSCSLLVKRVGGDEYVYAQGRVADGTTRQVYISPHDAAGCALIERFRKARADAANEKSAIDLKRGPGWSKRLEAGQKAMQRLLGNP